MIKQIRNNLIKINHNKSLIEEQIDDRKNELRYLNKQLKNSELAQGIIQDVAQRTQQELEYQISEIISLALEAIFDDPYEFKLQFVTKRGRTEAKIFLYKGGGFYDPIDDTGGGVVAIVTFSLRVALWNLSRPKLRNTMILDEPFVALKPSRLQKRAGLMLKELSEKLGIQFIIITHDDAIEEHADKVFTVIKKGRISKVIGN